MTASQLIEKLTKAIQDGKLNPDSNIFSNIQMQNMSDGRAHAAVENCEFFYDSHDKWAILFGDEQI